MFPLTRNCLFRKNAATESNDSVGISIDFMPHRVFFAIQQDAQETETEAHCSFGRWHPLRLYQRQFNWLSTTEEKRSACRLRAANFPVQFLPELVHYCDR